METLTIEAQEHLLLIGLNRGPKKNAFNLAMLRELSEAYTQYEDDPELWCAVLFAHGDDFTAGLDLAEVGPAVATGQPLFPEDGVDPLGLFGRRRSKPVVCAVQGWCLTIGIELLLASDVRVAASNTRFRQMEVNRGIMPFGGATLRFHELTGWGNAMRWLLTGDELDAAEAYRIGLVQEIVEPAELHQHAVALGGRIAARAPMAVQATMASARTCLEHGPDAAREGLIQRARALMSSQDAAEGLQSFIERREAKFQGK